MLPTPPGASLDEAGSDDDDPTCMHTVVPVASHAANIGSQCPVWMLGRFRRVGNSEKHTARTPRAALRSISFAASCVSQSGMMQHGMLIPIDGSHHSSTIQSL